MAAGPGWPDGTQKVIKYVSLDQGKLAQIAAILGIPEADQGDLWAVELYARVTAKSVKRRRPRKGPRRG